MPKRTNEFQRIVRYIYSQIVPAGGQVTESACLRERGNGPEREIDILIEHKIAGHSVRIAVEARDHARDQTVEWIDSLIGKYNALPVDLVVAVSSKKFSLAAKEKAADHPIDLITVNEALTTNWRKRIERWKMMTHSFTLMTIITLDAAGNEITHSDVSADGKKVTHRDELSEFMYNALHPWFMTNMSETVKKTLEAKIAEAWQT
jgi:Restriction endonuclease